MTRWTVVSDGGPDPDIGAVRRDSSTRNREKPTTTRTQRPATSRAGADAPRAASMEATKARAPAIHAAQAAFVTNEAGACGRAAATASAERRIGAAAKAAHPAARA